MEFWTFTFFALALTTACLLWKKSRSNSNKPPGPPKLPLIGNIHQLLGSLPHRRLADLAKTYGPFMHLQLAQASTTIVSSPQVAKQCLKDLDINFSDRGRVSVTEILFYNRQDIAFAPYGEYWRQVRKIAVLQLLSAKRVEMFRSVREEEVSDLIRSIRSQVGSPVNVSGLATCYMNSVSARTILGWKNENHREILPLISRLQSAISGFSVVDLFPSLEFIHVITGMKARLLKLHRDADIVLEKIIKEHKAELEGRQGEASSLLDVLLELQEDPDSPLTAKSVKAIVLEMFTGGTDTSVTVIEWAMSELVKNPSSMRKVQEEVRKVYVEYGKLDESVLHELRFLKAVVKEDLRLHPPAPLIPRQCTEKCQIDGYDIDAKTDVIINLWAIGRDPDHWVEPEVFYPERYLESEVDYKGFHFEYLPFGAGRRKCPGLLMAIANVELPLANLLCHFDWKLPGEMKPEDLDMAENFSTAVSRKNPLSLIPFAYQL